jgi:hypothetical protein
VNIFCLVHTICFRLSLSRTHVKQARIVELQTTIAWSNSLTRIFTAAGVDPEKLAELQSARDSVDQLELDLITELEDIFAQQHQDNMRRYDEINERFNIN